MKKQLRFFLFALVAMLSLAANAQRYEGETNKKGEPDGQGVMYFEPVYDGVASTERLEGKFKKGYPVEGKSFRYRKDDGRLQMRFEGKFKVKEKGVLRNLSDLVATGYIVFYRYENSPSYEENGYQVLWGPYDGKNVHDGFLVSCARKEMKSQRWGKWSSWSSALTPEAQKFLDELMPLQEAALARMLNSDEYPDWKSVHELSYKNKRGKIETYSFLDNTQRGIGPIFDVVHNKSFLMNKPLTPQRIAHLSNVFAQLIVERAMFSDGGWNASMDVVNVLQALPEEIQKVVIDKKNVRLDPEGKRVMSVREAAFDICKKNDLTYTYYDIFHDYGDMTQAELENFEERMLLGGLTRQNYERTFPNGRYVNKDLDQAWVEIYIRRMKDMLASNRPELFIDSDDSELSRNFQIPMLSNSMGGHNEDNSGISSFFRPTRVAFCFTQNYYMKNPYKRWSRIKNARQRPDGYDEAEKLMKLVDAMALANILTRDMWQTSLELNLEYWMGIQRMRVTDMKNEAIQIAREMSTKYPKLKPACVKAENHIKTQFGRLEKLDAKVSPAHREELAQQVKQRRATNCRNCKVDGNQTTFPSGWEEGWSFLFAEVQPSQSKTSGRIVLVNGKQITWKFVQAGGRGQKVKVTASGYIQGTYQSVDDMIMAFIVKCKEEFCD